MTSESSYRQVTPLPSHGPICPIMQLSFQFNKSGDSDCAKHLAPIYSAFFNLTQTRSHFAKNVSADI